ncbi:MAG: hypothetical protein REI78_12405 [Pedobacter sp.]|nr:hypothetical protein [Pedobacter sp.]MDQ8053826.1 hypothetical protein [Pedobacter sp.]
MENQELLLCKCCAVGITPKDSFCNACGFPLQGTKDEQDYYIANRTVKEIDLVALKKKVEAATNSLYWIGGFLAFATIVTFFLKSDDPDLFAILITNVILVAAFFALAVWSKTRPSAALITGLSLYVIVILLNAIDNPASLLSGIIIKIVIIGYLGKGIMAVLEVEKIKKELNIK